MRHPTSIAVLLLTLAGCGSSGSSEKLTGRAFGAPFTPVEVTYVGPADAACQFPAVPPVVYANSAVLVGFSSAPGLCALATDPCAGHRDLRFMVGTVAHAQLGTDTAPGLQPGAYTVHDDPTDALPDQNGEIRAAVLAPVQTDATCLPANAAAGTGEIRLDVIGPTELRGHVDVTFPDGGFLRGPFVATRCETTFEVCAGTPRACEGAPTCP